MIRVFGLCIALIILYDRDKISMGSVEYIYRTDLTLIYKL
jgi:hypothetical protein